MTAALVSDRDLTEVETAARSALSFSRPDLVGAPREEQEAAITKMVILAIADTPEEGDQVARQLARIRRDRKRDAVAPREKRRFKLSDFLTPSAGTAIRVAKTTSLERSIPRRLGDLPVTVLKSQAANLHVSSRSAMTKDQLVAAITRRIPTASKPQLRSLAGVLHVPGRSTMTKDQLVVRVMDAAPRSTGKTPRVSSLRPTKRQPPMGVPKKAAAKKR